MEIAKRLARQESESGDEAAFVHSSSWRYEAPGRVVLTYVAYSERFQLEGARRMPLGDLDAREGRSEEKDNGESDVVAHGMRHLAFLVRSGEAAGARKAFSDEAYEALSEVEGDLAGLL